MTIHELCRLFGISGKTVEKYRKLKIIPPPVGKGPATRYDSRHVEAIRAWRALQHNNSTPRDVIGFCQEQGITIVQYVKAREQAIRDFGIGIS